jgi:hypothetical protein
MRRSESCATGLGRAQLAGKSESGRLAFFLAGDGIDERSTRDLAHRPVDLLDGLFAVSALGRGAASVGTNGNGSN